MEKWKYLTREVTRPISTEELNRLGNNRWELIAFTKIPTIDGLSLVYIFKRPKSEGPVSLPQIK
jgi:hypothetical protein